MPEQGTAYEVPKSELEGKAIFPTVNTRNVKFEINFGKTVKGEEKVGELLQFILALPNVQAMILPD